MFSDPRHNSLARVMWSVAVIFLIGPYSPVYAQSRSSSSLAGVVVAAETGTALVGAVIEVTPGARTTRSDSMGRFRFEGLPFGFYTLKIRMLGHLLNEQEVELATAVAQIQVALSRSAYLLPSIEILRSRTQLATGLDDIPGSVQVVDREDDARFNPLGDVHETLRRVPGVQVQDEEGFGLRPNIGLRGTGLERSGKVTLMEDGVLIAPAPYAAPAAYYFPLVARMRAVEVRKGSSQIQYGPRTIGGAINLVSTSVPDRFTWAADFAGGANRTTQGRISLGSSGRHVGWLVEGYRISSDGFKTLPNEEQSTGFGLNDMLAKVRLRTDTRRESYQELEIKLGLNGQRADETYLGLTDEDFSVLPFTRYAASQLDRLNLAHRQLTVRHFIRPGGRFDLTTTAYRNTFFRNWFKLQSVSGRSIASVLETPSGYPSELGILRGGDSPSDALRVRANRRSYLSEGLQTIAGVNFGRGVTHRLQIGVRWHRDQEDRFQHEDSFQMLAGVMLLNTPGIPGGQSNRVSGASAVSWYLKDDMETGRWKFSPGIRYESVRFSRLEYVPADADRFAPVKNLTNSVSQLMPGMGVSFSASQNVRFFGSIHRGFAPPGPGADEATQPESSFNYEVGARFADEAFSGELVGFLTDYDNILGAATLSAGGDGSGDLFNGGAAITTGAEFALNYRPIPVSGGGVAFPAALAMTFTHARFQSAFSSSYEPWGNVQVGYELPYVAPFTLNATLGAAMVGASVSVNFDYMSAMRTKAGGGTPTPDSRVDGRFIVNATTDMEVGRTGQLFITMRNVTNARYVVARRPAGLRPGLPRMVVAGIRLRG